MSIDDNWLSLDARALEDAEAFRRAHNTAVLVIMFIDMVESTARREAIGEARFEVARRKTDEVLKHILISDGRGLLLKSLGDGYLMVFFEADYAVKRALAVQEGISADGELIPCRIGID